MHLFSDLTRRKLASTAGRSAWSVKEPPQRHCSRTLSDGFLNLRDWPGITKVGEVDAIAETVSLRDLEAGIEQCLLTFRIPIAR